MSLEAALVNTSIASYTSGETWCSLMRSTRVLGSSVCVMTPRYLAARRRRAPRAAAGRSGQHEVAQPKIQRRQGNRHRGDREPFSGELPERERAVGSAGDAEHHDVRAGAHRGQVAAEIGTEGERPPQCTLMGL